MELLLKMRKLDLLSPQVSFTVGGETGIKTLFGAVLTAIYLLSVVAASYLIGLTFFSTLEPTIVQEFSEGEVYSRVDFAAEKIVPVLYLFDHNVAVPPDQYLRYVTPIFTKYRSTQIRAEDGSVKTETFIKTMNVVPCSNLPADAYQYYKGYEDSKYFQTYANLTGLCVELDPSEAFIEGGGADTSVDMLVYSIYPCILPIGCVSKEQLRFLSVIFAMPTFSTNYSNYLEPVSSILNSDNLYYLNEMMSQKYQQKFMKTEIFDDRGVFFEKRLRTAFSSVDKVLMNSRYRADGSTRCLDLNFYTCAEYLNFEFVSSSRKLTVVRSYKSITKTISEIGGINSILMLSFLTLNLVYVFFRKSRIFAERIFGLSKISSQLKTTPSLRLDSAITKRDNLTSQVKKLREQAYSAVKEGLDVVSLAKEINMIKVISQLLFKDYHHQLMPLVTLSLKRRGQDSPQRQEQSKSPMSLQSALSQLKASSDHAESLPPDKQTLQQQMDYLCWQLISEIEPDSSLKLEQRAQPDNQRSFYDSQIINLNTPPELNQVRNKNQVSPQIKHNPALRSKNLSRNQQAARAVSLGKVAPEIPPPEPL